MDKVNYQKQLDKILESIDKAKRPSLLLHACCAPCSSYTLEYLMQYFNITVFYYNPNIHPDTEYHRRLEELKKFLKAFDKEGCITLVEKPYNTDDYFSAVNTENEPSLKTESERGERCRRCYKFRLEKAYKYAKENGFDWFTTTLSISPYKDADKINEIGKELESCESPIPTDTDTEQFKNPHTSGPKFLTSDFKKRGGFLRSLELSKQYGLYRQDYCGCIFSQQNMVKHTKEADN